jgi:methylisocitrate lyase
MARRKSLREAAAEVRPLVAPTAQDAFTARMIEQMGFKAVALGGSTMLAARYALPDLGLAALAEMVETARDILGATDLPCIMDGDDGYGDVKSVVRMIGAYDALGVGAVVIEDQIREVKQSGNNSARGVASLDLITQKIRAAVQTRSDADMMVIARCDAYGVEGLEASLRRCDAYLKAGADGIFIPGLSTAEELAKVGQTYRGTYQIIDMIEHRDTWLKPSELADLGFSQVVYPNFVMLRTMLATRDALAQLGRLASADQEPPALDDFAGARALFREIVRERAWSDLETRFKGQ